MYNKINKIYFFIALILLFLFIISCSETNKVVKYENLGKGENNSKTKPILELVEKMALYFGKENWDNLYSEMTSDSKTMLSKEQFFAQMEFVINQPGIPDEIEVKEIHFLEFPNKRTDKEPIIMPTFEGTSNILPNPIRIVSPVMGQVAIILCESINQEPRRKNWLTIVLHNSKGKWGITNFHFNASEIKEHDGQWFIREAERYENNGRLRNAFLYKNLGAQLLIPSPFVASLSASDYIEKASKENAPSNLPFPGMRPSEKWVINDEEFTIEYVYYVAAPTILALEFRYKSKEDDADSDKAKSEKEIIFNYIVQHFPEYIEAFDGIYIGSVTPWGKGFRDYFPFKEKNESNN